MSNYLVTISFVKPEVLNDQKKMQYCALCIHTLFLMEMLTPLSSFSASSAQLSAVIKSIKEQKNPSEVCDELDKTGNWFIYCSGSILAAMNLHHLELDSKTFVDRPLKTDPNIVREEFLKKFGREEMENINSQELLAFRERYFDKEGEELEKCNVPGWQKLPPKIARIKDGTLKQFAIFLNRRWKELCRRIKSIKHPERHSLIAVPKKFIVPGGRFREFYYWDAYWIIKGLIVSNLFQMVKNMLTNFLYCVKKFGFVPNGGRVYYLRRSQPPFLIPMVYEYYEATKDIRFIKENFKYLVEEFEFWAKNRSLITKDKYGKNHTVYQYRTISNVPRPESYRVDVEASLQVKKEDRQRFFQNLASAAESGWDFSSRWFKDRQKMQLIETTNVVPVDLNALLCWNANILKYLADKAGDETKATEFEKKQRNIWKALNAIFYNDTEKSWFDYNLRTKSHNIFFYPSNLMPLFTNCYSELDYEKPTKIIDFMNRSNLFVYQNGIPTSLEINSGQKWDFPNGWAPLQHIIIEGMRKSHNPDVQELAYKLARKWVLANYQVYQATNQMWDKIDVIGTIPKPGSGGEYKVQVGFGWTNGVILDLLATYYDRMSATEITQEASSAAMCCITSIGWNSWLTSVILAIITGHLYDRFI
ncbi:Trehalase [Dirofilaria immitis]